MSADRDVPGAFARCRDITRHRARNFHYGIRLCPEPQRSALYAVYAWMRRADDLVDAGNLERPDQIEHSIADFRSATDAALSGQPRFDDPLWLALSVTARQFHLPREHFHAMLDGQLNDARRTRYDTADQLLDYCHRVASTVGLICIEIWGYRHLEARRMATERGVAFQLTNILRDLAEDYDAGRVYLPAADFSDAGITPVELRQWSNPAACQAVIEATVTRAEGAYERSATLDPLIEPCGRPTLWAMTSIYQGLLQRIKRDPRRVVLGSRVRLSALHKCSIAVQAGWLRRFAFASDTSGHSPGSVTAKAPT